MKKIILAAACAALFALPSRAAEKSAIWNPNHLKAVKKELEKNPVYTQAYADLSKRADGLLNKENPSVMTKPTAPKSGDMHDYMSLARYYWPNPKTADGLPYISKDGESNPELENYDRARLGELGGRVSILAMTYYLGEDIKYADKALSMIDTWLLDPATRMNPNLNYAQVTRGTNDDLGRPAGVIDCYSFVPLLDALALMDQKGVVSKGRMKGYKKWFSELVDWMLTAPNGLAEASAKNNHSIAYDAQLIRFALFAGREDVARKAIEEFPTRRLAPQVKADGSQPDELRRTLAFHYSSYNIEHMLDICDMARTLGIELYPAANGAIGRAIDFLIPFMADQKSFPYKQISGWQSGVENFARQVLRASAYAKGDEYRAVYEKYKAPKEDFLFTLLYL